MQIIYTHTPVQILGICSPLNNCRPPLLQSTFNSLQSNLHKNQDNLDCFSCRWCHGLGTGKDHLQKEEDIFFHSLSPSVCHQCTECTSFLQPHLMKIMPQKLPPSLGVGCLFQDTFQYGKGYWSTTAPPQLFSKEIVKYFIIRQPKQITY